MNTTMITALETTCETAEAVTPGPNMTSASAGACGEDSPSATYAKPHIRVLSQALSAVHRPERQ
jgi:hypothetical protein